MTNEETPKRSYLSTIFSCRCPRCREGKLFRYPLTFRLKRNMDMYERCAVCGQLTDLEVGFYYGTGYVSYVLSVVLMAAGFVLWLLTIGFSFKDHRFFYWLAINSALLLLMQPWLMRFSRALWLSWFVRYDADWKNHEPEDSGRVVKDQMHNW